MFEVKKCYINPNSLDNKGSCWILKDFYCSVTMLRELGLKELYTIGKMSINAAILYKNEEIHV